MGMIKRILKILAILIVFIFVSFKIYEYKFYLDYVPDEFGVYIITYKRDSVWGFGPGGNETGIIVYNLPKEISKTITSEGLEYLINLSRTKRGRYSEWSSTPINPTRHWVDYISLPDDYDYSIKDISISHYLNAYGFGITVPKKTKNMIDNAIKGSRSYYSIGRGGIIIVIPEFNKVVYAYAG